MPEVVETINLLRQRISPLRRSGKSVGLVPTMGALHLGHQRLMERARKENDVVVVTIFVNPTQFNRKDDLDRYPRTLDHDLAVCREVGMDFVFAPSASEMYPREQLAWVDVPGLTEHLCGPGRPGHFRGVATVVMKLFQIVQADRAYFGEKDAQQLAVIRRMVADLNVPIEIVAVPTVREADGLAMSSRNQHLNAREREIATALSEALFTAEDAIRSGERSAGKIRASVEPLFATRPEIRLEYFSIVDRDTLRPVEEITAPVLIAGAMWLGNTRLIDNVMAIPPNARG
jgi:pantoate--beta-alanine ligase